MNQTKVNKALLRELPYYSCDLISSHGQFNNSLDTCLRTKKYLDRLPSFHDLDLFTLNSLLDKKSDDLSAYTPTTRCKYYSPHSFSQIKRHLNMSSYSNSSFSFFHTNIRSLKRNLENFQTHLLDELTFRFNILGITETRIKTACDNLDFNPTISPGLYPTITSNMCQHLFQLEVLACILMRILNTQLSKNVLMRLFRPFGLSYTYPNMQI